MATTTDLAKARVLKALLKIHSDLIRAGMSVQVQQVVEIALQEIELAAAPPMSVAGLDHKLAEASEGWFIAFHRHRADLTDRACEDIGNAVAHLERLASEAVRTAGWHHLTHIGKIDQLEARIRDLTEPADGG